MTELVAQGQYLPLQPDVDELSANNDLNNIFNAKKKLVSFIQCLKLESENIREKDANAKYSLLLLEKCNQISVDLEKERISHAEELRLINQDINLLEDILKRVQSDHLRHKSLLAQKMLHLKVKFQSFQKLARSLLDQQIQASEEPVEASSSALDCNQVLTWEDLVPKLSCSISTSKSSVPFKFARPTSIMLGPSRNNFTQKTPCLTPAQTALWNLLAISAQNMNAPNANVSQENQLVPSSSFNYNNELDTGMIVNVGQHTFAPPAQSPKLKICLNCQQNIHRNAPVCPFCKSKINSRANKRARKKIE